MTPWDLFSIGAAGALGALARYGVGVAVARRTSLAYPPSTFFINIAGAFLLGLSAAHAASNPGIQSIEKNVFQIGFLGAFTTFSTFTVEAVRLIEDGEWLRCGVYVGGSAIVGLLACALGFHAL
ncbi:fluoride efflux transporter CrcB [Heliobacterium gestii]|uniref:Fluoride-specific ion channel FluC n=1 Tax=Heliomicrobium gestii TaxID=2699 RepID=A0A845LEV0_HELGE|nr:CrcB family protein [Heliomicrobium gestii]MBM7867538.1 CrcB protein [Heliomicrobium gestii]MZP43914.1 fluoride efflux transporter CrcB [Heliomicrobium gestii]